MACAGVKQAEALTRVRVHKGLNQLDDPGVVRPLMAATQRGPGNAAGHAGPTLAHVALSHKRLHHIGPTLRRQSFRPTTLFKAWRLRAKSACMRFRPRTHAVATDVRPSRLLTFSSSRIKSAPSIPPLGFLEHDNDLHQKTTASHEAYSNLPNQALGAAT